MKIYRRDVLNKNYIVILNIDFFNIMFYLTI